MAFLALKVAHHSPGVCLHSALSASSHLRHGVSSPIGIPPLTRSASAEESWWAQRVAWYPTGCFGPYRSPEVGYSRRELAADAAVHLVGVVLGFVCGAALLLKVTIREWEEGMFLTRGPHEDTPSRRLPNTLDLVGALDLSAGRGELYIYI